MSDGVLLVAHLLKYVTEVFLVSISTSLYFQYSYYPCTPYHLIYSNLADFKIYIYGSKNLYYYYY